MLHTFVQQVGNAWRGTDVNVADILKQTGAVDSIARQLGVDSATAQSGAEALLPAILGGLQKQASPASGGTGGLGGLLDILGQSGGGNLLDAVNDSGQTSAQPGNDILGQIFGSKDVSRTVAGQAAQTTGLDSGLLKQMLPLVVMAVTGYLARQGGAAASGGGLGGGLGGILGSVLGGAMGGGQPQAGGQGGILGSLSSMIDMNGDGNPLDDILKMAKRFGG